MIVIYATNWSVIYDHKTFIVQATGYAILVVDYALKCFMKLTPHANVIKLFFFVTDGGGK
jgi:hypothetical protein